MDRLVPILLVAGLLAAWWWGLPSVSGGRLWNPLRLAFGTTAAALLFLGAGALGYRLGRHERFVSGAWSDSVIWWEVAVGLALVPVAAWFWRKGLRSMSPGTHLDAR